MISGKEVRALLGSRVRYFRQQRQLSQAALAEKADISVTFLSKIERGIKYPTSDTLSRLANGLDVRPADLFQDPQSPPDYYGQFERFKNDLIQTIQQSLEAVSRAYGE
jgi:transcriptional regulator with XRE-family HTH domain